jgi:hypothetical protein
MQNEVTYLLGKRDAARIMKALCDAIIDTTYDECVEVRMWTNFSDSGVASIQINGQGSVWLQVKEDDDDRG